jgi:hypothetical protein
MIRMPAFQLRLPEVMVCIHKAGRYNLPFAIDDLGVAAGRRNVLPNIGDNITTDEHIGFVQRNDTVIFVMGEYCATPKKDRGRNLLRNHGAALS